MKIIRILLVLIAITVGSKASRAADVTTLQAGDYIAICGDSITEQKIYSAFLEDYFLACQPAFNLQASQFGWGGETSWGFLARMQNDVLPFKPNIATLCYGMNDGDYRASDTARVEKYRAALTAVVENFKKAGLRGIVVGSPGPVDSTSFKGAFMRAPITPTEYNKTLHDLTTAAQKVAEDQGVRFANIHREGMHVMQAMQQKYGKEYHLFGDDGIHPNEAGHLVMTYAFLKALGCDGNIGTIMVDLGSEKATATAGHEIISTTNGTITVKSSRYPFCFYGDPSKPNATTGVIEFLPFNHDLNRFMLVVRNPPAGTSQLKLTWGGSSKEFPVAQLEKGINLAEEFLNNPFSEPFRKVHEAVLRQQRYETPMMKDMLHSVPDWQRHGVGVPDDFVKQLIAMDASLRKATVVNVAPVTHDIHIGR